MTAARLHVVIVEDEEVQRRQLAAWLADEPAVAVVGEAASGSAAVSVIDETQPDLVLLDVSLPELSGLDVLQRVRHASDVVFTTAYRDYAIEAFELGAVDYLLKPFGRDRLAAALRRVRERRADRGEGPITLRERMLALSDDGTPLARLFIRDRNAIVPIAVENIVRLEADGDYTAVVAGGRRHLIGMPLHAVHERIRRSDFVRIHRQHVVNLAHVARFIAHDSARLRVEFVGGGSVVASRAGSHALRRLID